jgi:glutamate-1-semialdehyde 2,1-aminomutase
MSLVAEGETMHGGTYNSNPLVCAAVIAAMDATSDPASYDALDARCARLGNGLVAIATEHGLPACISGSGALFQLWFAVQPPVDYRAAHAISATSPFPVLQRELRSRGVLLQPPQEGLFLPSFAHTDDDIDRTLEAVADAMPAVADAVRRGDVGPRGGLR